MRVSVHLHGILRDLLPSEAKGRSTLTLDEGSSVADMLSALNIQRYAVVSVNGHSNAEATHLLHDGDRVVVYTPVGGG